MARRLTIQQAVIGELLPDIGKRTRGMSGGGASNRGGSARRVAGFAKNLERVPQSVVKRVQAGGCHGPKELRRQIDYIMRDEASVAEWSNQIGVERTLTEAGVDAVIDEWSSSWSGAPKRGHTEHVILSFPRGTDAEAAENISREWAREVFGGLYEDRFRYVAALHHNTEQVHAHFVIDKVGMDEGRFLSIGRHSDINYDMMRQLHADIAADHGLALNATTRLSRGLVEHAPRQADIQAAMEEGREPYAAPMSDATRAEREAVVRSHAADYRELAALARVADDRDGWMARLIGKATDAVARIEEGTFRMQDFAAVNEVPAASLDAAGRLLAARETLLAEASNAWEKISEMDPGPERVSLEREFSEAAKATVLVFEKDAFFLSHASAVPAEADPYSVPMITALHDRAETSDGRFAAQADAALDRFMERLEDAFRDRADLFEANGTSAEEMAARFASRERSEAQLEVWRPEDANERATWLEVERDLRREAEAVAMDLPMERELVEDLARDALLESRQGERLADLAALDRLVSEVRSDLGDGDMDRIASGELDPLMDAIRDPALRAAVGSELRNVAAIEEDGRDAADRESEPADRFRELAEIHERGRSRERAAPGRDDGDHEFEL